MSNIIDSIQLSGVTYQIQGSGGGGVPESTFTAYTATTDERISQDEEVTAAALNELNEAVSGKQDTLSAGTNITIVDNVISAEGGSTYTAGRGISIANDTISLSLPISAGTGTNSIIEGNTSNKASGTSSHAEGYYTKANGNYSHAEGFGATANGNYSHAEGGATNASGQASHAEGDTTIAKGINSHTEGWYTIANNQSEHASGQYNVSSKAKTTWGYSGNTLFSVGNGTADNARHNAFEIRQNGDIYLSSGGTDIKLQDHLGGGGSVTVDTALDSGSTNPVKNRVIYNKIDEVEQVTAAGLNALNDNFGGLKLVKLTEAEYNALATKDSSTLYIIVN